MSVVYIRCIVTPDDITVPLLIFHWNALMPLSGSCVCPDSKQTPACVHIGAWMISLRSFGLGRISFSEPCGFWWLRQTKGQTEGTLSVCVRKLKRRPVAAFSMYILEENTPKTNLVGLKVEVTCGNYWRELRGKSMVISVFLPSAPLPPHFLSVWCKGAEWPWAVIVF